MDKTYIPTTILDVSKGLGYGVMYHPVIGKDYSKKIYPYVTPFSKLRSKKVKKLLRS